MKKLITFGFVLMCLLGCSNKQRNIEDYFNEVFPEEKAKSETKTLKTYKDIITLIGQDLPQKVANHHLTVLGTGEGGDLNESLMLSEFLFKRYNLDYVGSIYCEFDASLSSKLFDVYDVIFEYEIVSKERKEGANSLKEKCYLSSIIYINKMDNTQSEFHWSREVYDSQLNALKWFNRIKIWL